MVKNESRMSSRERIITAWIEYEGWFLPLDAIRAYYEGRKRYWDDEMTTSHPVTEGVRVRVQRAERNARKALWQLPE